LHFHDLRHTYTSTLETMDVSAKKHPSAREASLGYIHNGHLHPQNRNHDGWDQRKTGKSKQQGKTESVQNMFN
jgi:hypothetical protein